jgi:hypothetical protein
LDNFKIRNIANSSLEYNWLHAFAEKHNKAFYDKFMQEKFDNKDVKRQVAIRIKKEVLIAAIEHHSVSKLDEALNLARLDHAYIIKYIDSFIFNAKFHIVMELCEVLFYITMFCRSYDTPNTANIITFIVWLFGKFRYATGSIKKAIGVLKKYCDELGYKLTDYSIAKLKQTYKKIKNNHPNKDQGKGKEPLIYADIKMLYREGHLKKHTRKSF